MGAMIVLCQIMDAMVTMRSSRRCHKKVRRDEDE